MADEKRKAPDEKIFRLREEGIPVEEQYRWLIDGAIESVLEESDEDFLARLERPTEPEEAELLRAMKFSLARLLDTEEGRRKRRELDRELEEIGERHYEIPPTPEERRALLAEILEEVPPLSQELPGDSRDVEALSDGDVSRVLRRLAPLGDLNFYLDVAAGHWSEDVGEAGDLDEDDEVFREPLRAGTYSGPRAGDAADSL